MAAGVSTADERHEAAVERRALREQRAADRARSEEYVQGQRDQARHEKTKATRAKSAPRQAARRTGRRVQRAAVAPVSGAVYSAAGLFGIALSLVALYLVLTNVETVAKVIRLARHWLHWLSSPTKSIPYGKES